MVLSCWIERSTAKGMWGFWVRAREHQIMTLFDALECAQSEQQSSTNTSLQACIDCVTAISNRVLPRIGCRSTVSSASSSGNVEHVSTNNLDNRLCGEFKRSFTCSLPDVPIRLGSFCFPTLTSAPQPLACLPVIPSFPFVNFLMLPGKERVVGVHQKSLPCKLLTKVVMIRILEGSHLILWSAQEVRRTKCSITLSEAFPEVGKTRSSSDGVARRKRCQAPRMLANWGHACKSDRKQRGQTLGRNLVQTISWK